MLREEEEEERRMERQLIRDDRNGGRCSIVGLVPESIVSNLPNSHGVMTDGSFCAVVDKNVITIWKQRISTLSESLLEEDEKEEEERTPVVELLHPSTTSDDLHVGWMVHQGVLWLYACPTKSGTLCVWTLPSSLECRNTGTGTSSCNAHVLLPLFEGEYITSLTVTSSSSSGKVFLGTNQNSTWMAIPSSCPLELRARRLLPSSFTASSSSFSLSSLFFSKPTANTQPAKRMPMDDILYLYPIITSSSPSPNNNRDNPTNRLSPNQFKKQKLSQQQQPSFLLAVTKRGMIQVWKLHHPTTTTTTNHSDLKEEFLYSLNLKKESNSPNNEHWTVSNASMNTNTLVVAVQNTTKGQVYLIHCSLSFHPTAMSTEQMIRVSNTVPLSRYSKESIQSNKLSCVGLVLHSSTTTTTAYSLWQQQESKQIHPVTLSCIQFIQNETTKVLDYDLPTSVIPSIVSNAITKDVITDGCLFMSTSGVIANASIPQQLQQEINTVTNHQDTMEQLQLLSNHLSSAFQIHLRSSSTSSSSSNQKRVTVNVNDLPQSILSCTSSSLLSQAILQVAQQQTHQLNATTSNSQPSVILLLEQIKNLLETHTSFLHFCIHAGLYKKCNMVCKLALRDLGEIMYAIGSMCSYWQMTLEQQHQQPMEDDHEKYKEIRHVISSHFHNVKVNNNTEENENKNIILDFCDTFLGVLYNDIFECLYRPNPEGADQNTWTVISGEQDLMKMKEDDKNDDKTKDEIQKWAMDQFTSLLGIAIQFAMDYRNDKSETLYDIMKQASETNTNQGWGDLIQSSPWTSQSNLLEMIQLQLQYLMDQQNQSKSKDDQAMYAEVIPTFASVLLDGYLDIPSNERNEKSYHEAKQIAISSVQQLQQHSSPRRSLLLQDSLDFQLSLQHAYFEGIVSLAHPFTFADDKSDGNVTLFSILSDLNNATPSFDQDKDKNMTDDDYDSPYALLKYRADFETGYSFPRFVLWWYANRGLYGNVLKLGNHCPETLKEFMQSDSRLTNFSWIHQMREGSYYEATSSLTKLISNGFTAFGEKSKEFENKNCSLQDRKLVLSLAKLSATVSNQKMEEKEDHHMIDDNLQLVHAQSILMDLLERKEKSLDTVKKSYAMDADELLSFSLEYVGKLLDVDDKVTVAIVGISVAKVSSEKAVNAARVWRQVIEQDMDTWKILLENDMDMSDRQRARRISETVLYNLAKEYYGNNTVLDNVVCFKHNPLVSQKAVETLDLHFPGLRDLLKSVVNMSGVELISQ